MTTDTTSTVERLERTTDRERVTGRPDDPCWEWPGRLTYQGYGVLTRDHRNLRAHRLAYEALVGPIPEGMTLDHLCRNRRCVNPGHLEPVTNRVNVLRGEGRTAINARVTHCPQGHPYEGSNLYVKPNGSRQCRECHRLRLASEHRGRASWR